MRNLGPQLNVWPTAEAVVGAWIADNFEPAGRLGERLYNQPPQSRIANTTIVVIAISLTVVTILCYRWWH